VASDDAHGRGWSHRRSRIRRFVRSRPARPGVVRELRAELVAYASLVGADEAVCQNVALAVAEGLNNVAVHAYAGREAGPVHVEAWPDRDGHLLVRIDDEGMGIVPRTDSPGLGLGLALMAQMADDVRVANRDGGAGATVSMRFTLHRR
jgi:anti-sigma regulatory factor (Ser/Thr protein kinase)